MSNQEGSPGYYTESIFQVLENQRNYLKGKQEGFIKTLNQIHADLGKYEAEHQPLCYIFMGYGQDIFNLDFGLLKKDEETVFFHDAYELSFNDGESFGVEEYEYEVDEHPCEDHFSTQRSEALELLFKNWLIEAVWNSKLKDISLPLIYSQNPDLDDMYDLKDVWRNYHDFSFLES